MEDKQIISIKEARKIMGKESEKLSDEEIHKLIDDLDYLARYAIRHFMQNNKAKKEQR